MGVKKESRTIRMENSNMISETKFARGYSSFWVEYFPWLNSYSQSVKASCERFSAPLPEIDKVEHRSINNMMAFIHFRNLLSDSNYSLDKTKEETLQYMTRFSRNNVSTYEFNENDKSIVAGQITNLQELPTQDLILDPFFSGCGIIDNCRGDILQGDKLIEVKAGNRSIQPSDIKQLIVYLALNWIASPKPYIINQLEIYNPRVGYSWTVDVNSFFYSVTSYSKEDVFEQMMKYLVLQSEEVVLE